MSQQFNDEHASRVIAAIQTRAERKLKSGAMVQTTWATVASVDADQKTAGAYLYGETDGAYISGGFRIPETTYLTVGQKVKVAMNYATGERWIEEVQVPATAYKKIIVNLATGQILTGDGTGAPALPFLTAVPDPLTIANLTVTVLGTFNDLTITDDLIIGDDVSLASGSVLSWNADTTLARYGAGALVTAGDFHAGTPITAAGTGVAIKASGSIELTWNAGTPFIDFKNDAADDFDARIIYNLSSDNSLYLYGPANGFAIKTTNLLRFGGTSFPSSPSTDDQFYRTDLDEWFIYNGTAWRPGSKNPSSRATARSRWR